MTFSGDPATESELNRLMSLAEGVLRHITMRIDEKKVAAPAAAEKH